MTRKYALDDANLNNAAIITSRKKVYSDINLLFGAVPGSGDVYKSTEAAAVKQSVKNLLMTNFHERPFSPRLGSNIRASLFENNNAFTRVEIADDIRRCLSNFESRAQVVTLDVKPDPFDRYAINIFLEFKVISTDEIVRLNLNVERLR